MADGGGRGLDAARIDADLIARAVIAAARTYGDDPVRAVTGGTSARRCLAPAAQALARLFELKDRQAERLLGLSVGTLCKRRVAATRDAFLAATQAAVDDVRLALTSRPAPSPVVVARSQVPGRAPIRPAAPILAVATPPPRAASPASPVVGPVGEAVLSQLSEGACTPMALATILCAKESVIGQTLSLLAHQRLVEADPLGERGIRGQLWRLKRKEA